MLKRFFALVGLALLPSIASAQTLPAGVTLQNIDGGSDYYCRNGFTYACNAGWDNPNFFPIGPWEDVLIDQSQPTRWLDLGWNTAFNITANSSTSLAKSNGIWMVQPIPVLSGTGTETVGLLSADENYDASVAAVNGTANTIQDNRFWWLQNTWTVLGYGDIGGVPMAGIMTKQLSTPNGTTRHLDTDSADTYWFTGSKDGGMLGSWGVIYNLNRDATVDEGARGSNYGSMIDILRTYQSTYPAPIPQFVEDGEPGNNCTDAAYITPPELNWAVWSSIIHGARQLIYFNHSFCGSNQSQDNVAQQFYQTVQPGQSISIYNQIKQTDAQIAGLASVINSPTAIGYLTVSPAPSNFAGIDAVAKYSNGQFYILASTRVSESQTNIAATFTTVDTTATSVTVIGENRALPISNGVFNDTFATAATVHIYQIGGTGTPPPPVNGTCGSANGVASTNPPTANLCAAGTASAVQLVGSTYNWSCIESNGGTTAQCSAPQTPPPPPSGLVNGGFETGNLSGWTLSGNTGTVPAGPQLAVNKNAHDGTFAAAFGSIGSDGAISQTVGTVAGQTYTLSFWLKNGGGSPNDFTASWNGTALLSLNNSAVFAYKKYTFQVTAPGTTSTLKFSARNDPNEWDLDTISLVSTSSPPPTASISASLTLNWFSTNATSCAGTNFNTGGATSGIVTMQPTQALPYSVTCTGPGGVVTSPVVTP